MPLPSPLRSVAAATAIADATEAAIEDDIEAAVELEELVEWLGETVRQTDSSLLDEWEALFDPDAVRRAAEEAAHRSEPRPPTSPRPISIGAGCAGSAAPSPSPRG